jgi:glycerol-3-phosphate O-acyltransferase / dihydroxyacetone phosphate acyltransferase
MPPLIFSLNPSNRGALSKLKRTRETLSGELTTLINTLGPEIFPDFDASRVIAATEIPQPSTPPSPYHIRRISSEDGLASPIGSGMVGFTPVDLPRGERFENIADIQLFASRPPSRSGRRSRSTSFRDGVPIERLRGFTTTSNEDESELIDGGQESFEEVARRIRGGLAARRMERMTVSNGSSEPKKEA